MSEYDYTDYGEFKSSQKKHSQLIELARKIGIKNRYLKFLAGMPKSSSLIEIGCGDGSFMLELMREGYFNVRGVEPSRTYKMKVSADLISNEYAQDFLNNVQNSSVDGIIAWDVFEHIDFEELRELFKLISRKLARDGFVVMRVPNMSSPLGMINYYGDISHVTPITEGLMKVLTYKTGLKIESVHSEPYSYPTSIGAILGVVIWPLLKTIFSAAYAAFGIKNKVFTPNIIFILKSA